MARKVFLERPVPLPLLEAAFAGSLYVVVFGAAALALSLQPESPVVSPGTVFLHVPIAMAAGLPMALSREFRGRGAPWTIAAEAFPRPAVLAARLVFGALVAGVVASLLLSPGPPADALVRDGRYYVESPNGLVEVNERRWREVTKENTRVAALVLTGFGLATSMTNYALVRRQR